MVDSNWINRHPEIAVIGALVLCGGAVAVGVYSQTGRLRSDDQRSFYIDAATGDLFAAEAGLIPPIDGPDGPAFRAVVFSCGSCQSPASRYVGWIERYTPQAHATYEAFKKNLAQGGPGEGYESWESGRQIAAAPPPEPSEVGQAPKWISAQGTQADALRTSAQKKCGDEKEAQPCRPLQND